MSIFPKLPDGSIDTSYVVLIKRAREPGAGLWSLPGGRQELGENLATCASREAVEETGLTISVVDDMVPAFAATDAIYRSPTDGGISFHYAIVHVLGKVNARHADQSSADEVASALYTSSPAAAAEPPSRRGRLLVLPEIRVGDDALEGAWARIDSGTCSDEDRACTPATVEGRKSMKLLSVKELVASKTLVAASVEVLRLAQAQWAIRGYRTTGSTSAQGSDTPLK